MASKIYHGNPGSYKSSTAVWFDLVPALRAGRCVVTNVEGLLDLKSIEKVLAEKFPDSAQLWRFSTLNDTGHSIMARWFHWLPIGALLLIDEVQNVYSEKDRAELKEFNVDLGSDASTLDVMNALELLPAALRDYSMSCIGDIKDDGYTDDLALSERDSNGHIRYPRNIKDALMRHRKFNWDILLCTPDITKIHSLIRSVAETAVQHKSLDSFPIPYYQRRPRTFEHNAQEKGLASKKGDIIKKRKIPRDVFKLYKSTQTGKNNKSGAAASPLESNSFKLGMVLLLSILAYWVYFVYGHLNSEEKPAINETVESVPVVIQETNQVRQTGVITVDGSDSVPINDDVFYNDEPLKGFDFFATGSMSQRVLKRDGTSSSYKTFDLVYLDVFQAGKFMFSTDSDSLKSMGYQLSTLADCVYRVTYNEVSRVVVCYDKQEDKQQDDDSRDSEPLTLLASSPTRYE